MITDLQNNAVAVERLSSRLATQPAPQVCPTCQVRGQVIDTRSHPGYRRRRHQCLRGHRWTTYESFINPHRVVLRRR